MLTLEQSLGFLVNGAAAAMRRALEARLAAYGLSAPQWAVLQRLWERDGQRPSDVASGLHLDRPTVTGILKRMQVKGLVRMRRSDRDWRVVEVFLTPRSRALRKPLQACATAVNRQAGRGLSRAEVSDAKHLLERIWRNCVGRAR